MRDKGLKPAPNNLASVGWIVDPLAPKFAPCLKFGSIESRYALKKGSPNFSAVENEKKKKKEKKKGHLFSFATLGRQRNHRFKPRLSPHDTRLQDPNQTKSSTWVVCITSNKFYINTVYVMTLYQYKN